MESEPQIPSEEERREKLKWAAMVTPPPETDFPTWVQVNRAYPNLCDEEKEWILEGLLYEYHNKQKENNE